MMSRERGLYVSLEIDSPSRGRKQRHFAGVQKFSFRN